MEMVAYVRAVVASENGEGEKRRRDGFGKGVAIEWRTDEIVSSSQAAPLIGYTGGCRLISDRRHSA